MASWSASAAGCRASGSCWNWRPGYASSATSRSTERRRAPATQTSLREQVDPGEEEPEYAHHADRAQHTGGRQDQHADHDRPDPSLALRRPELVAPPVGRPDLAGLAHLLDER